MNKLTVIVAVLFLGALIAACTPEATEQEQKAMCDNLIKLRGEVEVIDVDEATKKVEERFAKFAKSNKRAAELEKEDWDAESEVKLKEMKAKMEAEEVEDEEERPTEEDLAALKAKYEAKKVDVDKRYAEQAKEIGPDKELALKDVRQKAEKSVAAFAKAVDECVAEAKKEPVPQPIAQCRAKATSTDEYFNKCR